MSEIEKSLREVLLSESKVACNSFYKDYKVFRSEYDEFLRKEPSLIKKGYRLKSISDNIQINLVYNCSSKKIFYTQHTVN